VYYYYFIDNFCYVFWPITALKQPRVSKANHLVDVSQELAQLIRSRKVTALENGSIEKSPAETKQKMARMHAVRQSEPSKDVAPITVLRLLSSFAF